MHVFQQVASHLVNKRDVEQVDNLLPVSGFVTQGLPGLPEFGYPLLDDLSLRLESDGIGFVKYGNSQHGYLAFPTESRSVSVLGAESWGTGNWISFPPLAAFT